jgi:hypothetical protein
MKKQLKFLVLLALVSIFIFILEGCEDNPKPDPCKDKTPTSAKFTIGERITNYPSGNGGAGIIKVDTVIVSDTVLNDQQIVFEALGSNYSYEWKIGDDPKRLTGKKVSLYFQAATGNFSLPSTIEVRLIAKKTVDKVCFPEDDGVDTLFQSFTIVARDQNPLAGKYEGYRKSNPSDVFTITISYLKDGVIDSDGLVYNPTPTFTVANLVKGCNDKMWWWAACDMSFGFRSMNFANGGIASKGLCKRISGWIFIDKKGNIQIPYYIISDDLNNTGLVKETFVGKLIR